MKKLDRHTFAIWSFEYDRTSGIYTKDALFDNLMEEDKKDYLDEADYYLSSSNIELPFDIIERAQKEDYEV